MPYVYFFLNIFNGLTLANKKYKVKNNRDNR